VRGGICGRDSRKHGREEAHVGGGYVGGIVRNMGEKRIYVGGIGERKGKGRDLGEDSGKNR
jgi:hypothetical protein